MQIIMMLILLVVSYYLPLFVPAHFVAAFVINNTSVTYGRKHLRSSIIGTQSKITRSSIAARKSDESDNTRNEQLWNKFSALTLASKDMEESVSFYQKLGLVVSYGSDDFTTLHPPPKDTMPHMASIYINLILHPGYDAGSSWGRVVIHVFDVDAMYEKVVGQGFQPEFSPRNAPWGERYFHLLDPSGHELSFAKPLE